MTTPSAETRTAAHLRARYTALGHLWYSWLHDAEAARERLEQVLGTSVPAGHKAITDAHWDALLAVVRDLLDSRAAGTTWLRETHNRGMLSHSLVDRLVKECHGPNADDIRAGWQQQSVLSATTADVQRLLRAGDSDGARALADTCRPFLRQWVKQIPDGPSTRQLGAITASQLDAYSAAWRTAKADLIREVRKLTVPRTATSQPAPEA